MKDHKHSIIPYSDYLLYISSEISKKLNPNTSQLYKNLLSILNSEQTLNFAYETSLKQQKDLLFKNLDEFATLFIHRL